MLFELKTVNLKSKIENPFISIKANTNSSSLDESLLRKIKKEKKKTQKSYFDIFWQIMGKKRNIIKDRKGKKKKKM